MNNTANRTTPLVTKLNVEWDTVLAARISSYGSLGECAGGALLEDARSASGAEQDEILYALLCLSHDGHRAAERLLVQLLVPAARRMAHRVRSLDEFDRTDRVGLAITAAWESIRSYRLHLRRRVMANLTMGMLSILAPTATANDRVIGQRTQSVTDDVLERVAGVWEEPAPTPDAELANLFTWAVDTNVITSAEVAVLSRACLGEETHDVIARDLGITVAGFRTRLLKRPTRRRPDP
jgi:hypothetical protein